MVTYAPQEAVGRGVLLGPERVGVLTDELQTVLQSVKQSRAAMRQRSIADPAVSVRASALLTCSGCRRRCRPFWL